MAEDRLDPFLAAMENFVGTEEESWKNGARRREDKEGKKKEPRMYNEGQKGRTWVC